MKLTPLEREIQKRFEACGRSDVTPKMATGALLLI
jgi:hypothetical protein